MGSKRRERMDAEVKARREQFLESNKGLSKYQMKKIAKKQEEQRERF